MGMFAMRKPRGFHHSYIYVDERKEKLAKMEEDAKRELGMLPEKEFSPEDIRGKFIEGTTHLKRRKESGLSASEPLSLRVLKMYSSCSSPFFILLFSSINIFYGFVKSKVIIDVSLLRQLAHIHPLFKVTGLFQIRDGQFYSTIAASTCRINYIKAS